jgi:hypothetical protein
MTENNIDEEYVRPPDETIRDCLIESNYDDYEEENVDEELKLALNISKKEYNEYIEEETIFNNIINESNYENLDYALELSKIEYQTYIDHLNNEKLIAENEELLMKNEELLIFKKIENRINSLILFCKKIERLNYSEEDRKMSSYIMNILNDWFSLKIDYIYLEDTIYKKIYEIIDSYYLIPHKKNYNKYAITKEEDEILRTIFLRV